MAKYKAYPEYKDSGVEWIDCIPSYWEVKPTFALCDASTQKNIDGAESNVLSLSYGNIIPRDVETNFGLLPESFNTYQIISCGDVILRLTDLQNDKNSLRVGLAKQKGIITSAYLKLKAHSNINPNFLYRLLHSYDTTKVFYGMGGGLRQSMKFEDFRRLPLLLPPYEEQIKISTFLDNETAKIDNLIEKQQQLIELLKEKRQAVISHAVTKGLNPDVPMKDSGVEWLGEVPAHWDSVRVKQVSSFITSGPRGWSDYITDDGDEIFLQSGDLNNELGLNLDKAKRVSPPKNAEGVRTRLMNGDVVICITGANTGRVAIVSKLSQKTYINQHLSLIRPETPKINSSFLGYCLTSSNGRSYFEVAQYGLKEGLNLSNIAEAPLALPPLHEQDAIVKYLKCVQNNYDYLSCLSANQVGLLQERRTALISAAVTGKIDVRDWVAPDTQNAEELQEATA
ncbi:restriction endonuclease subunit S [Pantoea vagans]|uniref:restriction endonuclease subunit S n=1 Tax=Pantoea vagans TaxID=470934 RepID=UPI002420350B|nr:restriction endonuclease subunit S [Pantoea vagans]